MSTHTSEEKDNNKLQIQYQKRNPSSFEELSKKIQLLIDDPIKLQNGYTILSEEENQINFCNNLLKIEFESKK